MLGRALRVVYSLIIAVIPLLYLGGYLSFIPGLPSPASLFGAYGLTAPNGFFDIAGGGAGTAIPFGTMGLSGLIAFQALSRVGRTVSSAEMMGSMPSTGEMMKQMSFPNMMGELTGPMGNQSAIPGTLPSDLTKSQFVVLRSYRQGLKSPKEISKALSMDKKEIEAQTDVLVRNGYLTKDSKLTAKGIDLLGS